MELNHRMIMNDELVRIRNEVVTPYLDVIFQHLPGWTEENQNKAQS
jgi:hypothetical protein